VSGSLADRLRFVAVDRSRWPDLETLFESRGGPKTCWCMVWRTRLDGTRPTDSKGRKQALHDRASHGVPLGLLGYADDKPVAWCSIAPRNTYRALGGVDLQGDDPNRIWSLACFFLKREFRGAGGMRTLLDAALEHARREGAQAVEAYPVDPDSPSYRFMGFVPVFEKAGFEKVGRAGARRHVLRCRLA
jgi:GNAT superfamily N-acetyltransferase